MRDIGYLQRLADDAGPAIGAYAAALLDHPLPWTKMRQVYALLGLVRKWGPGRVDTACARALEAEAVSVPLIGRMLARGHREQHPAQPAAAVPGRPAPVRPRPAHFATGQLPPRGPARRRRGMSPPAPVITPELRSLLRQVKLGQLMATLPERLALARARDLSPRRVPRADPVRRGHPPRRHLRPAPRPRRPAWTRPCGWRTSTPPPRSATTTQVFDELFSLRFIDDRQPTP